MSAYDSRDIFAVQAEVTDGGNADKSGLVSKVYLPVLNSADRHFIYLLRSACPEPADSGSIQLSR